MTLAETLRGEGGLLAGAVAPDAPADGDGPYGSVLAAIREGYEQHYGTGSVIRTEDRDLALLAGDRLYALGLALLAERGDRAARRRLSCPVAPWAILFAVLPDRNARSCLTPARLPSPSTPLTVTSRARSRARPSPGGAS